MIFRLNRNSKTLNVKHKRCNLLRRGLHGGNYIIINIFIKSHWDFPSILQKYREMWGIYTKQNSWVSLQYLEWLMKILSTAVWWWPALAHLSEIWVTVYLHHNGNNNNNLHNYFYLSIVVNGAEYPYICMYLRICKNVFMLLVN